MPYSTGTATNMADLTNKLITFVTGDSETPGRDWEILVEQNAKNPTGGEPFGSTRKEYVLTNVGLSGEDNVIVGLREWQYPSGNIWGWDLNVYNFFNPLLGWNQNSLFTSRTLYASGGAESYYNHPGMPLIDATMEYWFSSNAQRIIVVLRYNGKYYSMYLGFGNRCCPASEYPYPAVACGVNNGNTTANHAATDVFVRSCVDPYIAKSSTNGSHCPIVLLPDGNSITRFNYPYGNTYFIPGRETQHLGLDIVFTDPSYGVDVGFTAILLPIYIRSNDHLLMVLDGLYRVLHTNAVSEAIFVIDNIEYITFQNVFRSGSYDFFCLDTEQAPAT